ncbi:MAG: PGF-CTERM sorting domain-containing protein [Halobacterium sp.]
MRALALTALLVLATVAAGSPLAGAATGHQAASPQPSCTGVSFYTLPERPPPVTIGYSADENTSVFFVLTAGGEVVGHTDLQTFDDAVAVDGQAVPLERELSGFHDLTVTPHVDSNGNGEFDPGTDASCGSEYAATTTLFFPNHTAAVSGSLTAERDAAGALTAHTATVELAESTTVEAVAVDYLRAPTTNSWVTRNTTAVSVTASREGDNGTAVLLDASLSARDGLLVATLADPVTVEAGESVSLRLENVPNPRRNASTPLVVNPNGSAMTANASLNVTDGPVSDLAMFTTSDPSPPPIRVGFSVSESATVGFLATANGRVVGTSEFTSVPAGSHVDGFEIPVDAALTGDHEIRVYAVRDSNGNGEVDPTDRPYVRDGRFVRTSDVLSFGGERGTLTATYSPSEATTVSGVSLNLPAVGVGTRGIAEGNVSVTVRNASGASGLEPSMTLTSGGEYLVSLREPTEVGADQTLVVTVEGVAAADRTDDLSLTLNPNEDGATTVAASFDFRADDGTATLTPTSTARPGDGPTTTTADATDATTPSDANAPGFNAAAALVALAAAALLARSR